MPATNWDELDIHQIKALAHHLAKTEFLSYGFRVFSSEVDDGGADFIAEAPDGKFFFVYVRGARKNIRVSIPKDRIALDRDRLVCYVRFEEGNPPSVYVFPATVWKDENRNALFIERNFGEESRKTRPEYCIQSGSNSLYLLEGYEAQGYLGRLAKLRQKR